MKNLYFSILIALVFSSCRVSTQSIESTWQIANVNNQNFIIDLDINKDSFRGTSRKSALREIVGFGKYQMGVVLKKIPKRIVTIEGHVAQRADTIILAGTYQSFWSEQDFEAMIVNDSLIGHTTNKANFANPIKGRRIAKKSAVRDYVAITEKAIQSTEDNIFNPDIHELREWKKFKRQVLSRASKIQDDYEFWISYNIGVDKLPFSHYGIQFNSDNSIRQATGPKETYVEYSRKDNTVGILDVNSFSGDGLQMNACLDSIQLHQPDHLIIDLRDNSGGSVQSAMPLARYLTKDTIYGGVFLTQKWFQKNHDLPVVSSYTQFPHFTEASYSLITEGIHKEEGLCLRIDPDSTTYMGSIYVLTNKNTASTCEPFVYGLKQAKVAKIIGERTAGAMLNAEAFRVSDNFNLFLPTADYYASDGFKIDKIGVEPDTNVPSEEALEYALDLIKTSNQ